jgi:hypothetical protein
MMASFSVTPREYDPSSGGELTPRSSWRLLLLAYGVNNLISTFDHYEVQGLMISRIGLPCLVFNRATALAASASGRTPMIDRERQFY